MAAYESAQFLRASLAEGSVVGPFCKTRDPAVIEALGLGGFDFVILDMEHGPCGLETIGGLIRAAEVAQVAPIVRVRSCDDELIGMVLDLGAAGVQVPQIRSPEDLHIAKKRVRFSPEGERGVCKYVRAAGYSSTAPTEYFASGGRPLLIAQVEARQAVENLDAILDVGGLDILFIGPYDLSQSLGVTGRVDHPSVVSAMKKVVDACIARRVAAGVFVDDADAARHWGAVGVKYICLSVDMGILVQGSRRLVESVRYDADPQEPKAYRL
jgi:4-hydroxy-2-oxoheptanedioate aldolase